MSNSDQTQVPKSTILNKMYKYKYIIYIGIVTGIGVIVASILLTSKAKENCKIECNDSARECRNNCSPSYKWCLDSCQLNDKGCKYKCDSYSGSCDVYCSIQQPKCYDSC